MFKYDSRTCSSVMNEIAVYCKKTRQFDLYFVQKTFHCPQKLCGTDFSIKLVQILCLYIIYTTYYINPIGYTYMLHCMCILFVWLWPIWMLYSCTFIYLYRPIYAYVCPPILIHTHTFWSTWRQEDRTSWWINTILFCIFASIRKYVSYFSRPWFCPWLSCTSMI